MVMFWPSCAPNIAPTTGPACCRSVCRVTQSVIVRSTSGWSCTVGLASEARVVETSGFPDDSAMSAGVLSSPYLSFAVVEEVGESFWGRWNCNCDDMVLVGSLPRLQLPQFVGLCQGAYHSALAQRDCSATRFLEDWRLFCLHDFTHHEIPLTDN